MRTLLAKDLRILRALAAPARACWSLYPLVVALLIGLTLSRGSDKPRVALLNEVPPGESLDVGTGPLRLGISGKQVRDHIEPVHVVLAGGGRAARARRRRAGRADHPGGHRSARSSRASSSRGSR